jgi:hypothetical protein
MTDFPDTPDLSDIQTDLTRERPATVGELTRELSKMTQERFDRVVPLPVVKAIIEGTVEYAFRECARLGHFRLPGGWGTLQLRWIKGTEKPIPTLTGDGSTLAPREDTPVIRLSEGASTRALLQKTTPAQYHRATPRRSFFDEGPKDGQ